MFFDLLPCPAWVYDSETLRFLEVNAAAIEKYGYSRQEFLSMTLLQIRPAEEIEAFERFLALPFEQRVALNHLGWRHCAKDGTVFEVEAFPRELTLDGRCAVLVIARDIRVRREAEEERRRAEEAFRALFDDAPVPYHEIDRDGVVVRVNRAECETLGVDPSLMIGRPVWNFVSPSERATSETSVRRKLQEGTALPPFERKYLCRDSVERTFEIHERIITNDRHEVMGMRTAMLDLSASKVAQQQIAFQASLLNQVTDAIAAVDEEFRVTYWNAAAERLFGRRTAEVIGIDYADATGDTSSPEARSHARKQFIETGQSRSERVCRHPDGSEMIVELTATVFRDDTGKVRGGVGLYRDLTAERRAQDALAAKEHRFELAKAALEVGTWDYEVSTGDCVCSPELLTLLGIAGAHKESVGVAEFLSHVHIDDRSNVQLEFETKEMIWPRNCEFRVAWPDGTIHWILSKSNAILDRNQRPKRTLGVALDITAQKETEDRLRILSSAVEQSPVSIIITDRLARILYANPKASEITGYSPEELLGQNPRLLKSGDTSVEEYQRLWNTIPNGVWRGVFHNKKKNGESFWEAATIGPIRNALGEPTHYLAVKEDITERRAIEAALRLSEERFRVAAQSSGDVVYEWDLRSDEIQLFSDKPEVAAAGALGQPHSAAAFLATIHPDDRSRVMAAMQRNWETGEPYKEEYRLLYPSGEMRHWSDCGSALRDASGKAFRWVGVGRDVTEARRAERANAELAAIVQSAETAIFTRDLDYRALSWNAGAERIYGYPPEEVLGKDLRFTVPPDQTQEMERINERIQRGERITHLETVRLAKGGGRIELMMSISPIFDRSGKVVEAAHLVWDISEIRQLQRQLAQAQKLESVGQLAAGIAHEINTPIQYVSDNADFLATAFRDLARALEPYPRILQSLRAEPSPALADSVEEILQDIDITYLSEEIPKAIGQLSDGVQQVARIVRAMKEFSHPGNAEKTPLDVNKAIESTILVSRNEWKYVADLSSDLDPALPLVPCHGGEINQVILNLIVNAAHAIADVVKESGRKGAIRISTCRHEDWAEICIADTGTGIPEAIRSKIFDPFFTTKDVGRGTGQGLAIAHNVVVKKHGGRLSFESECGTGTIFKIQLPLGQGVTS